MGRWAGGRQGRGAPQAKVPALEPGGKFHSTQVPHPSLQGRSPPAPVKKISSTTWTQHRRNWRGGSRPGPALCPQRRAQLAVTEDLHPFPLILSFPETMGVPVRPGHRTRGQVHGRHSWMSAAQLYKYQLLFSTENRHAHGQEALGRMQTKNTVRSD